MYRATYGTSPRVMEQLPGAGSNRHYFRLYAPEAAGDAGIPASMIGTVGEDLAENRAFITLADHFRERGIAVPEVYAASDDGGCYLQQDLGSRSLFAEIERGRGAGSFDSRATGLMAQAMELLAAVQYRGADGLDFSVCYPDASMNRRMIDWDLSYFKYCFLKPSGIEVPENGLQDDFARLGDRLYGVAACADTFMVRDFQSRNVMVTDDGMPYLIDFQGGRRGPAEYDVASFLWQARASVPDSLRVELIDRYVAAVRKLSKSFDEATFRANLPQFVLFRLLQVLGAYGFRGWMEGKSHFLQSIPAALASVASLLDGDLGREYPVIKSCIGQVRGLRRIGQLERELALPPYDGLTVKVFSFSYKKGVPPDLSGNGGGFLFDCRAVHNPGRYERYKALTGRDEPVRRFLEDDGEMLDFLGHCQALVDSSVTRYLMRGFSSLSVGFGCTGGQHRSVYGAESMARHIKERFPQVRVLLVHVVQDIMEVL